MHEYLKVLLVNQLCSFDHFKRNNVGVLTCKVSLAGFKDGSIKKSWISTSFENTSISPSAAD